MAKQEYKCTVQDWIDALSKHNPDSLFFIESNAAPIQDLEPKRVVWRGISERQCHWDTKSETEKRPANVVCLNGKYRYRNFIHKFEDSYYGELLQRVKEQLLREQLTHKNDIFSTVLRRLEGCPRKIYFFPESNNFVDSLSVKVKGVEKLFEQHEDTFIWISKVPHLDFLTFCSDPVQYFLDKLDPKKEIQEEEIQEEEVQQEEVQQEEVHQEEVQEEEVQQEEVQQEEVHQEEVHQEEVHQEEVQQEEVQEEEVHQEEVQREEEVQEEEVQQEEVQQENQQEDQQEEEEEEIEKKDVRCSECFLITGTKNMGNIRPVCLKSLGETEPRFLCEICIERFKKIIINY